MFGNAQFGGDGATQSQMVQKNLIVLFLQLFSKLEIL